MTDVYLPPQRSPRQPRMAEGSGDEGGGRGARGSPGWQRAPGMGVGERRGLAQLAGPHCWSCRGARRSRHVQPGLAGWWPLREGSPQLPSFFFLSKFESKAVQGLRGWRGDAEGSSKLSQGRERQGPRPAGPGQGPGEVYRPTWLRAGQAWAELATGGPAGPSTSRALRVLDIG